VNPARVRRRRGLLLLSLALASGGLAASEVGRKVGEVEARVGAPVPVVVAREALAPGKEIPTREVRRLLDIRDVPEAFASPDALADPSEAAGLVPAVPVAAGSQLTVAHFAAAAGEGRGALLGAGERAIEVAVAGGEALSTEGPGGRVDVVVSTEPHAGAGRTFVALEDVEVLSVGAPAGGGFGAGGGEGAAATATAAVTLRVTARQAVYLTAAQNFAREIRLLPRPPGDRGRAGRFAVEANGL
jgi:pilus assembly protein CpaB